MATLTLYGEAVEQMHGGAIDLVGWSDYAPLWVALFTSDDIQDHNDTTMTDIFTNYTEASDPPVTNYVRKQLQNVTVTRNATTITVDADDLTWLGLGTTQTLHWGCLYYIVDDTDDDLNIPVAYLDFGSGGVTLNGNNFTIQWNSSGIWQATIS